MSILGLGDGTVGCLDLRSDQPVHRNQRRLPFVKLLLVAAVALIDKDGRVLLAQRPGGKSMAGMWEFPGGKVEDGETPEAALIRELHEELGIETWSSCLAPLTFASHSYPRFPPDHAAFCLPQMGWHPAWHERARPWPGSGPSKLRDYPMPPADIPLIPILRDWL